MMDRSSCSWSQTCHALHKFLGYLVAPAIGLVWVTGVISGDQWNWLGDQKKTFGWETSSDNKKLLVGWSTFIHSYFVKKNSFCASADKNWSPKTYQKIPNFGQSFKSKKLSSFYLVHYLFRCEADGVHRSWCQGRRLVFYFGFRRGSN